MIMTHFNLKSVSVKELLAVIVMIVVTHLEPPKNHASTLYEIGDPSLFCLFVFRSISMCLNRNLLGLTPYSSLI